MAKRNLISRIISGVVITVILLFLVGFIIISYALWDFTNFYKVKFYTPNELVENFNLKKKEIYDVKTYFKSIAPANKVVEIEFASDDEIARLCIIPTDTAKYANQAVEFLKWDLKIDSKKVDSILVVLGWTNNQLSTLKDKLDKANCISITNSEPSKIGFKRSGLGMYFFNVFDKPISDKLKPNYNDSCQYIYINKYLVLEYGGGAIGPQCFPVDKTTTANK